MNLYDPEKYRALSIVQPHCNSCNIQSNRSSVEMIVFEITKNVRNLRSAFSVPKPRRSIITSICSFPAGSLLSAFSTRKTHNFSSSRKSCFCTETLQTSIRKGKKIATDTQEKKIYLAIK